MLLLLSRFVFSSVHDSPPGSAIPGILQARKNIGVGHHFLLQCMKVKRESGVWGRVLCCAWSLGHVPWTAAHQLPLSMQFSRQEYWSGLPCPPPGALPTQGLNPHLCISCTAGGFFTTEPAGKPTEIIRELKCLSIK